MCCLKYEHPLYQDFRATTPEVGEFVDTDDGLVAYLTLRLGANTLADAHADASRIEELIRRERPEITDVVVHTEPQ